MYGFVEGEVLSNNSSKVIVKTQSGIGFEVNAISTFNQGDSAAFYLSHVVNENFQALYGFTNLDEKLFFELLRKVNKVGPSIAFRLIHQLTLPILIGAILDEDTKTISSAKGVGKALADKIVLDLKKKIEKEEFSQRSLLASTKVNDQNSQTKMGGIHETQDLEETILALESLGYRSDEVMPIIRNIIGLATEPMPSKKIIQQVLKEMRL
ncbi:helix-hairpin-helix domain-containing protein [Bacteriovoracaceae bacterium]|nr:helix-hairpin-helix domain-containing protein [Bacteriovoracaceae bacterium]